MKNTLLVIVRALSNLFAIEVNCLWSVILDWICHLYFLKLSFAILFDCHYGLSNVYKNTILPKCWNFIFIQFKLLAHITNSSTPHSQCIYYQKYKKCIYLHIITKLVHKINIIIDNKLKIRYISGTWPSRPDTRFTWFYYTWYLIFNGI